jgi:hypothetical protein
MTCIAGAGAYRTAAPSSELRARRALVSRLGARLPRLARIERNSDWLGRCNTERCKMFDPFQLSASRPLLFMITATALAGAGTFVACESSGTQAAPSSPCCPADDVACEIPMDDAGQCLACCRGDQCGYPPETDGACPGPSLDAGGGASLRDEHGLQWRPRMRICVRGWVRRPGRVRHGGHGRMPRQ